MRIKTNQLLTILALLLVQSHVLAASSFLESSATPEASIITSIDLTEADFPATAAQIDEDELMTILEAEDTLGATVVEDTTSDFLSTVQ